MAGPSWICFQGFVHPGKLKWLQFGLRAERIWGEQAVLWQRKEHSSVCPFPQMWGAEEAERLLWSDQLLKWSCDKAVEKGFWEDVTRQYLPPKVKYLFLLKRNKFKGWCWSLTHIISPGPALALKGPHLASVPGLRNLVFAALSLF